MLEWLLKILTAAGVEITDAVKQELEAAAPDNIVAKKDYDTDTEALRKQTADLNFENALTMALAGKVKNIKAVINRIDKSKLTLKEDKSVDGLDEELQDIKSAFHDPEQAPPQAAGREPVAGDDKPPAAPATLGAAVADALAAQAK